MRTTRVVMLAAVLAVALACDRAKTDERAQEAATQVRSAAAHVGDRIADGWVTTKIQAHYFVDREIKERFIDVSTRDGNVTLKGYVESAPLRDRAAQLAQHVDGVRRVDNQLLIGQTPSQLATQAAPSSEAVPTTGTAESAPSTVPVDDERIMTAIQARFFVEPSLKSRHIDVGSGRAVVTLRGEVASERERAQALSLARSAAGVERVEDGLTVNAALGAAAASNGERGLTPPTATAVDDGVVTSELKQKMTSDPQLKANAINVTTTKGVVVLEGTVPNLAMKHRAIALARESQGVVQVVDRLQVSKRR